MERLSDETRQLSGCGLLPPPAESVRPFVTLWVPMGGTATATVCPGYSTSLPEVFEIARARLHWSKGSLRDFCHGQPSDAVMTGVEILEGASNECESWSMKNRKGGS